MNCKISVRYVECRVKDHFLRGGVPILFPLNVNWGSFYVYSFLQHIEMICLLKINSKLYTLLFSYLVTNGVV